MYHSIIVDKSQPLDDRSSTGRRQPWAEHRTAAEILAVAYEDIDSRKADRLRSCAPRLFYTVVDADGVKRLKLHTAWFCRVRLCPVCQWRRSLKVFGQAAEVIRAANAKTPGGYGWIMLTLTVRNVEGAALPATIDMMGKAWHRLLKVKRWTKAVLGTMRSLEVTHNISPGSKSYDTYHPHYHALLCVRKSYFKSRDYINHAEWVALWRKAARLNYDPRVDVRRIYGTTPAAIAEVAKYAAKPGDYIVPDDVDLMLSAVQTLDGALNRRRLVAWTGLLKEIHAELQLDDTEDGDLVHTDINPEEDAAADEHLEIAYSWLRQQRNYFKEVHIDAET